jgi:hypothetical protein
VLVIRDEIVEAALAMAPVAARVPHGKVPRIQKAAVSLGKYDALRRNPSQQCETIVESGARYGRNDFDTSKSIQKIDNL